MFKIAIEGRDPAGGLYMVTFGLVEGAAAPGGANPVADAAEAAASALVPMDFATVGYVQSGVRASDVQPGVRPSVFVSAFSQGIVAGEALPPQCAAVVRWITDVKGPANRGRMFVPGIPEGTSVNGFLQAEFLDPLSAWVSSIFDPFAGDASAYQLNVLSYVPNSSPRALRAAVPVTAFTIDNVVRTQRRREVGRGA